MRATFAAAAATARALGDPGCSAARRSATPGGGPSSGASRRTSPRCSRRRSARSAARTPRCARGCSRGSRSSSTTPATRPGGSRSPRRRSRSPAGSAIRCTLAACLDARHYALWRPETVQERLAVASELRRIAEAVGDPELELEGAGWTVVDLLELGDVAGADIQIAAASRLAAALHRPLYEWWTSLFRCARAQIDGRFDEAERLARRDAGDRPRGQAENAVHVFAQAMFNIRREQGRLAEVEEAVHGFIAQYPAVPAWRCSLALLHARARARGRGARRVRRARRRRLRRAAARRAVADRDDAARRGLRAARRRRARAAELYAPLAPVRRAQRRRRPRVDLQRLRVAPARHPRRLRGEWARAERHFARRAGDARRDGRAPVRRAHAGVVGGDGARPRARRRGRASGWRRPS